MARPLLVLVLLLFLGIEAAPAGAQIELLDPGTGAVTTPIRDQYTALVRWSDDGSALVVRKRGHIVSFGIVDGAVTPQPWLDRATAIGPRGRSIAIGGYPESRLELRGPDGSSLASYPVELSLTDATVAWSSDGTRVAVAALPDLLVLDASSGALVLRRRVAHASLTGQAFAPDSSALVVADGQRVLRIELASSAVSVLFRASGGDAQPAAVWGADGRVAVTVGRKLQIVGGAPVPLRVDALQPAAWKPDGSALSYAFGIAADECSYPRDGLGLVVPGQAPRVLIEPSGRELRSAAWSPDGRLLAVDLGPDYDARRPGKHDHWPRRIARSYEMFSRRGDAAVRQVVVHAARALRRGLGREETLQRVRKDFARVDTRFSEASDTAVLDALGDQLDKWLVAAGFHPIDAFDEITC